MKNEITNPINNYIEDIERLKSVYLNDTSVGLFGSTAVRCFDWETFKFQVSLMLANAVLKNNRKPTLKFNDIIDIGNENRLFNSYKKDARDKTLKLIMKNKYDENGSGEKFVNVFETYNNLKTVRMITGEAYFDNFALPFTPKLLPSFRDELYVDLYTHFYASVLSNFGGKDKIRAFMIKFFSCEQIIVNNSSVSNLTADQFLEIKIFYDNYLNFASILYGDIIKSEPQNGVMAYLIEKHLNITLITYLITEIKNNNKFNLKRITNDPLLYEFLLNRLVCIWMINCSPMPINYKLINHFLIEGTAENQEKPYLKRRDYELYNLRFADRFTTMTLSLLKDALTSFDADKIIFNCNENHSEDIFIEYKNHAMPNMKKIEEILNENKKPYDKDIEQHKSVELDDDTCILLEMIFTARSIVYNESFF